MALNFSHRPVFPARLDCLEGIPERSGDGFGRPWHSNREVENPFDYGKDVCERSGSQESVSNDILDLLPSDPFGMDMSTTFTAITGWLEDLEVDYGGYGRDEVGPSDGSYQLFAELNYIWNNAMRFQTFPGNAGDDHKSNVANGFGGTFWERVEGDSSSCGDLGSACAVSDSMDFSYENWGVTTQKSEKHGSGNEIGSIGSDGDGGALHGALNCIIGHLGMRDLLALEGVCRFMHAFVRGSTFLWRHIHIQQPLNERITDDALLQLANRAQGSLECLSLVECSKITDNGLRRVLECNPKLTKLSVPGCTRVTIEGIMASLKSFKCTGAQGVTHLRIGGIHGVTAEQFDELKMLLGTDSQMQQSSAWKPRYYSRPGCYLSCEDDNSLDIQLCPRCEKFRLVYDCPAEGCQGKGHESQFCRACTLCIPRCVRCGSCTEDSEYEENFCLEVFCSVCWIEIGGKRGEKQDGNVGPSNLAVLLHG
ncbi:hypothetical protein UlMin_039925 [Ulmus minor]